MFYYGLEWQSLDSYMQFKEISQPATPPADEIRQYASDSGGESTMCWISDAGNVKCLPPGAGTIPVGTGSAGAVAIWSDTNTIGADASRLFWDFTNDQLLIGIASGSHYGTDSGLVVDEDGSNSIIASIAHSATAGHGGSLNLGRSRGTHAAQTTVATDDRVSRIVSQAFDGTAYRDSAAIDVDVASSPSGGLVPGRLSFRTTGTSSLIEAMRISSLQLVAIGGGGFSPDFQLSLRGSTNATGNIVYRYAAADATGPGLSLHKFRGSFGSEAATNADDLLGTVNFGGWTNAEKFNAVRLEARAGSLWTSSNAETYFLFQTTPSGSLTRAERFRIGSAGQWGIGGATFGGSGDIFSSGGASAAPTWVTRATLNAALDHGTLAGLTDDDHAQYALLAGRSGGQILIGGTAAADDLTLRATSGVGAGSETITAQVGSNGAITGFVLTQANSQAALRINGATGNNPLAIRNITDAVSAMSLVGDSANCNFTAGMYTANTNGPTFVFFKGRGTAGTPGQTLNGDTLFSMTGRAIDDTGAQTSDMVALRSRAAEDITTTGHGSYYEFLTVDTGSTTQTSRMFVYHNGAIELTTNAWHRYVERTTTPSNPTSGAECNVYMKDDKFIIQFNNGGTVRYKYLDLTGTGVTWVHTTTAP